MESLKKPFLIDNFELKLTLAEVHLIVEAQDRKSLKKYSTIINNDAVVQISSNHVPNVQAFYQVLIDFFETKEIGTEVKLLRENNEVKLFIAFPSNMGPGKSSFNFSIGLEEEKDPNEKMERRMEKISKSLSSCII